MLDLTRPRRAGRKRTTLRLVMWDLQWLVGRTDAELAQIDPVVQNLLVARAVPALADIDIDHYVCLADCWAAEIAHRLPYDEEEFHKTPQDWANCIHLFRLGVMCTHLDRCLGIAYNEDQREAKKIRY